jgi:predicted acylesterase/phospholipase RssA
MSDQEALVLTGGGSLGAYQVGVLKALARGLCKANDFEPFDPGLIVGTSVGAFNATFLAAQGDVPFSVAVDRLEALWRYRIADRGRGNGIFRFRLDPIYLLRHHGRDSSALWARLQRDFRHVGRGLAQRLGYFLEGDADLVALVFGTLDLSHLVSLAPLRQTVRRWIDFSCLGSSPREVRVIASTWPGARLRCFDGREPIWLRHGPRLLADAIALPGIFPSTRLGAETLVDGALISNTPIGEAIRGGARTLHLVLPYAFDPASTDSSHQGSLAVFYRSIAVSFLVELWLKIRALYFLNYLQEALEDSPEIRRLLPDSAPGGLDLPEQGPITVCAHIPRRPLGFQLWHFLDFGYERIAGLIDSGFRDAQDQVLFDPRDQTPQLDVVSLFEPFGESRSSYPEGMGS